MDESTPQLFTILFPLLVGCTYFLLEASSFCSFLGETVLEMSSLMALVPVSRINKDVLTHLYSSFDLVQPLSLLVFYNWNLIAFWLQNNLLLCWSDWNFYGF